jgi:peptidoglycan/xylan/chitin deacetylase (PgdA/CDA1 family)
MSAAAALRLDDVGAASKMWEVYGLTRLPLGRWSLPFPGNVLFLKYLPPIKRWGPYRELGARDWDAILATLHAAGARLTVAVTAGWVERDGGVTPYPKKFADAARTVREGVRQGVVEIANHGYTHCVLDGRAYRPRWFSGNRRYHREFADWVPAERHREHIRRAQDILQSFFETAIVTFVPPGNAFTRATLAAAAAAGLRYVSCRDAGRFGAGLGVVPVDDQAVCAIHDRDVVRGGPTWLTRLLESMTPPPVTVREVVEGALASAQPRP